MSTTSRTRSTSLVSMMRGWTIGHLVPVALGEGEQIGRPAGRAPGADGGVVLDEIRDAAAHQAFFSAIPSRDRRLCGVQPA
ncbi:hypothetical protein FLX08_29075 [Microbispora hainanensis]|uniref:Uncharacterized protein n=1 Tax=Microbispora hainanensis TaxID=568844 RepID=A0A544YL30_9ACTN|nr:hypothetical protein FLX08_29075 [Microbispora hainanensis]